MTLTLKFELLFKTLTWATSSLPEKVGLSYFLLLQLTYGCHRRAMLSFWQVWLVTYLHLILSLQFWSVIPVDSYEVDMLFIYLWFCDFEDLCPEYVFLLNIYWLLTILSAWVLFYLYHRDVEVDAFVQHHFGLVAHTGDDLLIFMLLLYNFM